jgi:two-component system, NtrC family, sensor kinase
MVTIFDSISSKPHQSYDRLTLESTLQMLPLYSCTLESRLLGKEAVKLFDQDPLLPGVILIEQEKFVGMISRRQFMEQMSRPYGLDLFLKRSFAAFYPFISAKTLVLPHDTPIVSAVHQALQRPPELLYEPIVVSLESQVHGLIDLHELLVAQSQIHELARQLLNEQTQAQMIQTEKMASLGRTIASVAHEILNPVNFVSGNLNYLSTCVQTLFQVLSTYEGEQSADSTKIEQLKDEVDFNFLRQDLPRLLSSLKLGSERLKSIVEGLRNFSHMDESKRKLADIHTSIDNTLVILNSRLKHDIRVVKHYGDLPLLSCYSGQLSQVFMNIISNAIDALVEKIAAQPSLLNQLSNSVSQIWEPQIIITTTLCQPSLNGVTSSEWISVRISDNGPGIPPEIQGRIFETFFTTKPMGKGTGLGLAISHQIVTEKHKGKLNLKSDPKTGTEFEILLPVA